MRVTASPPPTQAVVADGRGTRSSAVAWCTVILAFALGVARFAWLLRIGAVNVPFGDQWDFLLPLFRSESAWSLFLQQHGPHRQGVGGILQWLLYSGSGWDVRLEAWAGLGILFVTAVAAVALAARLRGRLAWWDSALVLIVLSPLHWETLLLAPNLAHSIVPLCLTLLLAHAWLVQGAIVRVALVATLGALCTFTGFGFCASVAAGLLAIASLSAMNGDRRIAAAMAAAIGLGLALFLINYQWAPAIPGWRFPVPAWWNYGTFGAYMAATLVGLRETTSLALVVGGALGLALLAAGGISFWQIWTRGATPRTVACALLSGTCLVYVAFTAVGRLPANVEASFMWRYTSLTMTGVLGAVLFLDPWLVAAKSRIWRNVAVASVCTFAVTIWINLGPDQRIRTIAQAKRSWVQAYRQTHDLARANEFSDFWVYPPQPDAPQIAERLRWLEQRKLSFFKDEPDKVQGKEAR